MYTDIHSNRYNCEILNTLTNTHNEFTYHDALWPTSALACQSFIACTPSLSQSRSNITFNRLSTLSILICSGTKCPIGRSIAFFTALTKPLVSPARTLYT